MTTTGAWQKVLRTAEHEVFQTRVISVLARITEALHFKQLLHNPLFLRSVLAAALGNAGKAFKERMADLVYSKSSPLARYGAVPSLVRTVKALPSSVALVMPNI